MKMKINTLEPYNLIGFLKNDKNIRSKIKKAMRKDLFYSGTYDIYFTSDRITDYSRNLNIITQD